MGIKVSIITPCLNSEKTIRDTIESVLGQTYDNIEYILVDGGSTDRTVEIIEEYYPVFGGRLQYTSEKDKGIYDAMNKGIIRADGDVIGIINSDDWYENDVVKEIVQCFESTDAGVVYGEIWVINENDQRMYHTHHSTFPPHPSTFVRREVYQRFGTFDLHYQIAADRELLLRLMMKGIRFVHINEILANFRKTGISNARNLVCARETYEINIRYLGKCPVCNLNRDDIEESYSRSKLLYISYKNPQAIRKVLSRQCDISDGLIIFGAGNCGIELAEILRICDIPIVFYVDNDEKKWGFERHGITIYSPEILKHVGGHVVVTVTKFQKEICNQIQNYANSKITWSILKEVREAVISSFEGSL